MTYTINIKMQPTSIDTYYTTVKCKNNELLSVPSKIRFYKTVVFAIRFVLLTAWSNMVDAANIHLEDILTEKQVHQIVKQFVDQDAWRLADTKISPASEGLTGFLGNHLKVTLYVKVGESTKKVYLFLKCLPLNNKPKAEFIRINNFYKREMIMFQLFEQFHAADGPQPWCTRAVFCNESIVVMPDLTRDGYSLQPQLETLDMPHTMAVISSLARFHAAFANYEVRKTSDETRPYNFLQEHEDILEEPTFKDSEWLHAAAKLTTNMLKEFSIKYKDTLSNLENEVYEVFLKACDSLKEYKETLNVLIHKDLWINNIMFSYENGVPVNAVLIDFQCVRYTPPAFDVMIFLYFNSSRDFRERHEKAVLDHYYSTFYKALGEKTKEKVEKLSYNCDEFYKWCEISRLLAIVEAIGIFPYVLMDPVSAQKTYDDPETYVEYLIEDRTEPVVSYANRVPQFKHRFLEVCEELIERYVS